MTKKQIADKFSFKITNKVLWGLLGSLIVVLATLIGRWSVNVDQAAAANDKKITELKDIHNKEINELKSEIIPLKTLMPEIKKTLENFIIEYKQNSNRLEKKLDRHISNTEKKSAPLNALFIEE